MCHVCINHDGMDDKLHLVTTIKVGQSAHSRSDTVDNLTMKLSQAIKEGKTIQFNAEPSNEHWWIDLNQHTCSPLELAEEYGFKCLRVKPEPKPEPKLRPWKPEEVPVGALLRSKDGHEFIIMGRDSQGYGVGYVEISAFNNIRNGWQIFSTTNGEQYSLDHGKTWLPCGEPTKVNN